MCPLVPEKLNDVAHQNLQAALHSAAGNPSRDIAINSKAKAKQVYDCSYLQNIEMSEQDCRLYVPLVFRK